MKKNKAKKLTLARETLTQLGHENLPRAVGASMISPYFSCCATCSCPPNCTA